MFRERVSKNVYLSVIVSLFLKLLLEDILSRKRVQSLLQTFPKTPWPWCNDSCFLVRRGGGTLKKCNTNNNNECGLMKSEIEEKDECSPCRLF